VAKALLFDVGDVLMENNWVLFDKFEAATGRVIRGRGPYAPNDDEAWLRHLSGEITADEYWNRIATQSGYVDRLALWGELSWALGGEVFNADALQLVDDARTENIPVGILTNDLVGSSGRAWVDSRPELSDYDVFVDCTEFGQRKPAPAPYLKCVADFALNASDIVFLDDTPKCVDGARAVGLIGILVDPIDRNPAFAEARALVELPSPPAEWRTPNHRVEMP
jgi:putative hydrolase of the HAD superfamily